MGNGSQKQVINPNNNNINNPRQKQQNQTQQYKGNQQLLKYIRQSLRNVSSNGMLTKDKFNQALAMLEGLGFKRLRDTPLADKLFVLFDKNKSGSILEEDFSNGITSIINDKNNAIIYTFQIYNVSKNNIISKKQFTQFIQESWMAAFRIISENLDDKKYPGIKVRDIEIWAKSKISILNEQSNKLFAQYDKNNKGQIEFPEFKEFVLTSKINDVVAKFDQITISVPLNLVHLFNA